MVCTTDWGYEKRVVEVDSMRQVKIRVYREEQKTGHTGGLAANVGETLLSRKRKSRERIKINGTVNPMSTLVLSLT